MKYGMELSIGPALIEFRLEEIIDGGIEGVRIGIRLLHPMPLQEPETARTLGVKVKLASGKRRFTVDRPRTQWPQQEPPSSRMAVLIFD